jgi:hypothetical protein
VCPSIVVIIDSDLTIIGAAGAGAGSQCALEIGNRGLEVAGPETNVAAMTKASRQGGGERLRGCFARADRDVGKLQRPRLGTLPFRMRASTITSSASGSTTSLAVGADGNDTSGAASRWHQRNARRRSTRARAQSTSRRRSPAAPAYTGNRNKAWVTLGRRVFRDDRSEGRRSKAWTVLDM